MNFPYSLHFPGNGRNMYLLIFIPRIYLLLCLAFIINTLRQGVNYIHAFLNLLVMHLEISIQWFFLFIGKVFEIPYIGHVIYSYTRKYNFIPYNALSCPPDILVEGPIPFIGYQTVQPYNIIFVEAIKSVRHPEMDRDSHPYTHQTWVHFIYPP